MGNRPGVASTAGPSTDADRFRVLYDGHVRPVTAYCARRVAPDGVDDAVAETFLVAWRRIGDVPDGDAGLLWLYAVAHRVVGHEYRSTARRRRLTSRLGSLRTSASATPEDDVIGGDKVRRVLDAASRLNASDVEILRLVAWERLSSSDIAAVLDLSPNAVHQRLHRARANLTRQFDKLDSRSNSSAAVLKGGAQ